MDLSLGELVQGGGLLAFAGAVLLEVRAMRRVLEAVGERLAVIETACDVRSRRTRHDDPPLPVQ